MYSGIFMPSLDVQVIIVSEKKVGQISRKAEERKKERKRKKGGREGRKEGRKGGSE